MSQKTLSQQVSELNARVSAHEAKQKMFNEYVKPIAEVFEDLRKHVNAQEKEISETTDLFRHKEKYRQKQAMIFVENKTVEELRIYLADRPIAYNSWKNAELSELVKLAVEIYDEEED
jgi:hypothetical protein